MLLETFLYFIVVPSLIPFLHTIECEKIHFFQILRLQFLIQDYWFIEKFFVLFSYIPGSP